MAARMLMSFMFACWYENGPVLLESTLYRLAMPRLLPEV